MFKHNERFDYCCRNLARQQKIIEVHQMFLRYYQWSKRIILWKETKVLFSRIIVHEISSDFRVVNRIEIGHGERRSVVWRKRNFAIFCVD